MNKNKRKLELIVILLLLILTLVPITYSYYSTIDKKILTATVGGLISEAKIDQQPTYVENNKAYFILKVNNFDDTNKVSDVDYTYTLTITNNGGIQGEYTYQSIDDSNIKNETPSTTQIIKGELPKDTKTTKQFKVYVIGTAPGSHNINYKVVLSSKQKKFD